MLGENNIQVMKVYKELINEHSKEPVNQSFDDMMSSVPKAQMSDGQNQNLSQNQ